MRRASLAFLLLLAGCVCIKAAGWETMVNAGPAGPFPEPRPLRANYRFGWSGFTAANAAIRVSKPAPDRLQIDGTGQTSSALRALWKFSVNHTATADRATLRPIRMQQSETARGKNIKTELVFSPTGVARTRGEGDKIKTKNFDCANLFDLWSALLYIRSQPLQDGSSIRLPVYPATAAYLTKVTVSGHENVKVAAGSYSAIKLDLQLNKIGKNNELEAHKKFKRATIWISDDPDRLLLRVEAEIFVGSVFAELESVSFDGAAPPKD